MNHADLLTRMKTQIDNSEYLVATVNSRARAKSVERKTIFAIFTRAQKINASIFDAVGTEEDVLNYDLLINPSYVAARYRAEKMNAKPISKFLEEVRAGLNGARIKSDKIVTEVITLVNGVISRRKALPICTPAQIVTFLEGQYGFASKLVSNKYSHYGLRNLSLFVDFPIPPFSVRQENDQEFQQKLVKMLQKLKLKVVYGDASHNANCLAKIDGSKIVVDKSLAPDNAKASNIVRVMNILYAVASKYNGVSFGKLLDQRYPTAKGDFTKLPTNQQNNANTITQDIANLLVACNMARYLFDAETYTIIENAIAIKISAKLKFLNDKTINKYVADAIQTNFTTKQVAIFQDLKMDILDIVNGYDSKGIELHNRDNITEFSQILSANQTFKGLPLKADKNLVDESLIKKITNTKSYKTKLIQLRSKFEIDFLSMDMRGVADGKKKEEFIKSLQAINSKEVREVNERLEELKGKKISDEELLTLSSALLLRDLIDFEANYVQSNFDEIRVDANDTVADISTGGGVVSDDDINDNVEDLIDVE